MSYSVFSAYKLTHCQHFIVSSYQRWEVGSKIAVHTFPNLPDCLDLHLQKNHRVLKQSTWNQSLNTLYSVFIWKIHVYVSNANVYKWYINFIKNLNTTHQRQKIYKRSPRPVERWAHQLEYLDQIKDLNETQWFPLVSEIGIKKTQFRSSFTFWWVSCDGIEDVDEDKEEGDKKSHPTLQSNYSSLSSWCGSDFAAIQVQLFFSTLNLWL